MTELRCEDVRPSIAGALDHQLHEDERARLDAHLLGCAACREEMARAQALLLELEGLSPALLERDLWKRVADALPAPAAAPAMGRLAGWLAAIAAIGVLARMVDLAWLGGAGFPLRLAALALIALVFAAVRINPFRLVDEAQLVAAGRSR